MKTQGFLVLLLCSLIGASNLDGGDICHNETNPDGNHPDVAAHCNDCEDKGCFEKYGGYAFCLNLRAFDQNGWWWKYIETNYDLNSPIQPGLCGPSLNTDIKGDCCRCMKRKKCHDVGCGQKFHGNGICIDLKEGDLTQYPLDFSVPPEFNEDLCRNVYHGEKDNCCACFKKKTRKIIWPFDAEKKSKCNKLKKQGKCDRPSVANKCGKTCNVEVDLPLVPITLPPTEVPPTLEPPHPHDL